MVLLLCRFGVPILMTVMIVASWWFSLSDLLKYERSSADEEVWRFVTANFAHINWKHMCANLLGLWCVWLLVGQTHSAVRWIAIVLLSSMVITASLHFLQPAIAWYLGFSGVALSILVSGSIMLLEKAPIIGASMLIFVFLKILFEQSMGKAVEISAFLDVPVIYFAHLAGALCGAFLGVLFSRCVGSPEHG